MSATRLSTLTKPELEVAVASSLSFAGVLRQLGLPHRQGVLIKQLKTILCEMQIAPDWVERRRQEVSTAVALSSSATEALSRLGLGQFAGNYKTLNSLIKKWRLNTTHWRSRSGGLRGSSVPKRPLRSLTEILISGGETNSFRLKRRLVQEGLLKEECAWNDCPTRGMKSWRGGAIKLDLDHINGDTSDNRLENLRLLCKLCHAQTETFSKRKRGRRTEMPVCLSCGKPVSEQGRRCRRCAAGIQTRIKWPDSVELVRRIARSSVRAVARELGVTDNAIRLRIKNHSPG